MGTNTTTLIFVHHVLSGFYKNFLDYTTTNVYTRFRTKLVSTYDKAVIYLSDKEKLGREQDKPNLPCIILNPSGDINLDEAIAGGKQPFRFPNMTPGFAYYMFEPLYQDSNVQISPSFGRIKAEVELIMLVNSFYEYCDLRLLFLQHFRGQDRVIKLKNFNGFIILPKEVIEMRYQNDVTGEDYQLDFTKYGVIKDLIKTTNKSEYVYPYVLNPLCTLNNIGDASNKYGGTDKLADWRLTANFTIEVDIPWYLAIHTNYLLENIKLDLKAGSVYSLNNPTPPLNREIIKTHYSISGLDSTSSIENIILPSDSTTIEKLSLEFNTRYYHLVTQHQSESTDSFSVSSPEIILDEDYLLILGPNGQLNYVDDYIINDQGNLITFYTKTIKYQPNDILELYVYKST